MILGLGNPILTDDGVGIHVVRALGQGQLAAVAPDVVLAEASAGGLRLLELLVGYDRVIIVDAIQTPAGRPGEVYRLRVNDLRAPMHTGSSHDLSLAGALALGRSLRLALPDDEAITIIAVEVEEVLTFGEGCTSLVQAALPRVARTVAEEVVAGFVVSELNESNQHLPK